MKVLAWIQAALFALIAVPAHAGTPPGMLPGTPPNQDAAMTDPERLQPASASLGFDRWIAGFRTRALAAGKALPAVPAVETLKPSTDGADFAGRWLGEGGLV